MLLELAKMKETFTYSLISVGQAFETYHSIANHIRNKKEEELMAERVAMEKERRNRELIEAASHKEDANQTLKSLVNKPQLLVSSEDDDFLGQLSKKDNNPS